MQCTTTVLDVHCRNTIVRLAIARGRSDARCFPSQVFPAQRSRRKGVFVCVQPNCGKVYTFASALLRHEVSQHNRPRTRNRYLHSLPRADKGHRNICNFPGCTKEYFAGKDLNKHRRIKHPGWPGWSGRIHDPDCQSEVDVVKDTGEKSPHASDMLNALDSCGQIWNRSNQFSRMPADGDIYCMWICHVEICVIYLIMLYICFRIRSWGRVTNGRTILRRKWRHTLNVIR